MAFIGDLDSDMFMAKLWDQPYFIFIYIYIFTSLISLGKNILKIS